MASNTNKTDALHNELPANVYKTRTNPNIKALIEAAGTQDQFTADLIEEVKNQLFLSSASGKYLNYIGSNNNLERPRLVGLSDALYRKYISILANDPKQVKTIADSIIDLFYEKGAVYAFSQTENSGPFALADGVYLEVEVDGEEAVRLQFATADFANITSATVAEVALAINKKYDIVSAAVQHDYSANVDYLRLFTKTRGSSGSVKVLGGSAQNALRFEGFTYASPNSTQWTVTKIGDLVTFTGVSGSLDLIDVAVGDYASITLTGNTGVFEIESVNVTAKSFSFRNLLGTVGVQTQTLVGQVNFTTPTKRSVWNRSRRALSWQTGTGSFDIEMPATPIMTRTDLQGSSVLNGRVAAIESRDSDTQLTLDNISGWPTSGYFFLKPVYAIYSKIVSDVTETTIQTFSTPFDFITRYSFSGKSGSSLTGIVPSIPAAAALDIVSPTAISSNVIVPERLLVTFSTAPSWLVDDYVAISGVSSQPQYNGVWKIVEIGDPITQIYLQVPFTLTDNVVAEGEVAHEEPGFYVDGSLALLGTSLASSVTEIASSYVWDTVGAEYVISSESALTAIDIDAGNQLTLLSLASTSDDFPESGSVVFDFGLETEEGPITFTQKLSDGSILIDTNYSFRFNHDSGSSVRPIRQAGPRVLDGTELAPYVCDPAIVRALIQDLITNVKSAGIFANFLVKYPDVIYSVLDFYNNIDIDS